MIKGTANSGRCPLCFLLILRLMHFIVETAKLHQFIMISLLHDISVADNQDTVCMADSGETVCHDETSLVFHECAHRCLDLMFRASVDVGSCLVEDQHRSLHEQRSRDGEKLFLSFGNISTVVDQQRIVALRQALDIVVDMGCFCCCNDFLAGRFRASIGDILINRAIEQPGILQNHRVGQSQALSRDVCGAETVHENLSAVDIVEAHQQVDECRFSCAGWSDDGNEAAFGAFILKSFKMTLSFV